MEYDTDDSQAGADNDRSELSQIKTMDVTALKQNRGGNVHENANDKRHEFTRVLGQRGVRTDGHAQGSHRSEEAKRG